MYKENELIVDAVNKYGKVPDNFECLKKIKELEIENKILKDNNRSMQDEMNRTWERTSNLFYNMHYDELHHYRVMRDIEEILKNKDEGFIQTYDKLEKYIKKEMKKYE